MRLAEVFTRDEIRSLTARSDARGAWAIASTWMVIATCFAVLARFPHPLTFLVVVLVLGGRQLALAILMHEASHHTLFERRVLNDVVADWLCARPVWNDVARYRKHHLRHHAHAGTDADPDWSLARPFPTTRAALARKLLRDATGISGLRRIVGLLAMDFGYLEYTVAADATRRAPIPSSQRLSEGVKNLGPVVLTNAVLVGILFATGHLWVYSAWIVAWLTTFSVYIRIRSIAEHACTERTDEVLRNTRTTRAGLLARMTVAPFHVNFHIEHHLMAAVPCHRLPAMHRLLRDKGLVAEPPGYLAALALATH